MPWEMAALPLRADWRERERIKIAKGRGTERNGKERINR